MDKVFYKVCGRVVGRGTGCDVIDDNTMMVYNLDPSVPLADGGLPTGDVVFAFQEGLIQTYDDEGEVTWTGDFLEIMIKLPKEVTI